MLADYDRVARMDISGEIKCGSGACLDVGGVDKPHGPGTDLQVLTPLDEALGNDARERRADHRLTNLILRLTQLRLDAH